MKFRIIDAKDRDFFNYVMEEAVDNYKNIPKPLPWVEPSINMPYLEIVSSFIFGQYFSSILTTGILLEHILRMAIIDPINCGKLRKINKKQINKFRNIELILKNKTLQQKITNLLENNVNIRWWKDIAAILRNASAHMIFQELLKKFGTKKYLGEYFLDSTDTDPPGQWGFVWHKFSKKVSQKFLLESTEQMKIIIKNTKWKPDLSWWISQKYYYDSFFSFEWGIESMINSLERVKGL